MTASEKDSNWQCLRVLLPISALIGAVAILWTISVASSRPEGYHDKVYSGISPNGKRAFWFDKGERLLHITNLDTGNQSVVAEMDARQIEWSSSGDTLFFVTADSPRHFAWISPEGGKIQRGPPAEYFTENPETGSVLLFEKPHGFFEMRSYRIGDDEAGSPRPLFDKKVDEYGRITGARVSPDGSLLGVCMREHRGITTMEVRRLVDWNRLIQGDEHAEFFFFGPDNRRLIAVRNTAARMALHDYDLVAGTLSQSSEEMNGWCEAAKATPDRGKLAMGQVGRSKQTNHIELYETAGLSPVAGVILPGERSVIDLRFTNDGGSVLAIGRTGRLWKWNMKSNEVVRLGWVTARDKDTRWLWAIGGLIFYSILWGVMIHLRRGCQFELSAEGKPQAVASGSNAVILLVVACVFEVCKLSANFIIPMEIIGQANMILVMGHVILGVTVLVLVVSMAVLRVPAKWPLLVATALVLAVGAAIDFFIFAAAVASV